MVGSGRPLLPESSLSPTSPPASAIRSSRSKARSRDWTPPLVAAVLDSADGTSAFPFAAGNNRSRARVGYRGRPAFGSLPVPPGATFYISKIHFHGTESNGGARE